MNTYSYLSLDPGENGNNIPLPYLMTEVDPVSETLCSLVLFRKPDDEQSPKSQ
jgi:hypothetical protein